jgi:hypothetical protein
LFSTTKATPRFALTHWIFPNAGDPFCQNIVVIFLFFVFPDQGLNCFDLEGSRVFFVKFPELSLFSNQWTSTFHRNS